METDERTRCEDQVGKMQETMDEQGFEARYRDPELEVKSAEPAVTNKADKKKEDTAAAKAVAITAAAVFEATEEAAATEVAKASREQAGAAKAAAATAGAATDAQKDAAAADETKEAKKTKAAATTATSGKKDMKDKDEEILALINERKTIKK